MKIRKTEDGVYVTRDRFSGEEFYPTDELKAYGETLVENFTGQSHFAYFGDLEAPPWGQLGFAGQHRDSDALDRSNHEVIRDALLEARPDSFRVEGYSHFLVGWVDVIRIDTSDPQAVAAAKSWHDALENYPVADDEHFSQTEHEEDQEYYRYGGRDDAIEILKKSGEFPELFASKDHPDFEYLEGDFLPQYNDALNEAFHDAMAYGDHTAIPDDELPEAMRGALDAMRRWEHVKFEEVQPPLTDA